MKLLFESLLGTLRAGRGAAVRRSVAAQCRGLSWPHAAAAVARHIAAVDDALPHHRLQLTLLGTAEHSFGVAACAASRAAAA